MMRARILALAFLLGLLNQSYADSRFSIVGHQNRSTYEAQGASTTGGFLWGGGVLAELVWPLCGHLEMGALYVQRSWQQSNVANFVVLPLSCGFWLNDWLGASAGAYYASGVGQITLNSVERSFADAQFSKVDFGATAALKLNLPFQWPGLNLHLELRYNYGLANVSTAASTEARLQDLQILVGLRFGSIGGSSRPTKAESPSRP
jgi:hypothetical protein